MSFTDSGYIYAYERWDWKNNAWIRTEGLSALDDYRHDILSVPDDTPFMPPIPRELTDINKKFLCSKYVIDRKKTIIMIPCYNGGRISALDEMWHELVKELNTLGYVVYTNIGWSEKPLNGTLPMITTMSELNYLADKINCVIGLRCGLLDFLANTAVKLFTISHLGQNCELELLFPDSNCQTLYYWEQYWDKLQPTIERHCENLRDGEEKELFINGIALSRIYFDKTKLLKKLLSLVTESGVPTKAREV